MDSRRRELRDATKTSMKFNDIPGHEDVKSRLRNMADTGKTPHALLLEGPAGTGKLSIARAFAQYLHCEHPSADGDSCGRCASCLQHEAFNHIDTIFSFPVVKKDKLKYSDDYLAEFKELMAESLFMNFDKWVMKLDNINAQPLIYVDEANELIRKLNYTAHGSKYKIVIMWLPERMKEDAANKLLKLVEEPYSDTIFIFVSDNGRQILPTIYSRTQRIPVKRYDDRLVANYLVGAYQVTEDEAADTAHLANGNMATAIDMLSVRKDSSKYLELFMELMRKAYTRHVADLKKWAEKVNDLGRERAMKFYDYCSKMMRENFIMNINIPGLNYMTQAEREFSTKFSPFINERNVEDLITVMDDAKKDIGANASGKLVNFDVAIKVILFLKK